MPPFRKVNDAPLWPSLTRQALDLHDENVVRMEGTGELAVIDPYLSLARKGTWAAVKLAEVGITFPEDDPLNPGCEYFRWKSATTDVDCLSGLLIRQSRCPW